MAHGRVRLPKLSPEDIRTIQRCLDHMGKKRIAQVWGIPLRRVKKIAQRAGK